MMGESASLAFVESERHSAIIESLQAILEDEGWELGSDSLSDCRAVIDAWLSGDSNEIDDGAAVVFVVVGGASGWSIVLMAPHRVLARARKDAYRIRLADLAFVVQSSAIACDFVDGTTLLLTEADATGVVLTRGLLDEEVDRLFTMQFELSSDTQREGSSFGPSAGSFVRAPPPALSRVLQSLLDSRKSSFELLESILETFGGGDYSVLGGPFWSNFVNDSLPANCCVHGARVLYHPRRVE